MSLSSSSLRRSGSGDGTSSAPLTSRRSRSNGPPTSRDDPTAEVLAGLSSSLRNSSSNIGNSISSSTSNNNNNNAYASYSNNNNNNNTNNMLLSSSTSKLISPTARYSNVGSDGLAGVGIYFEFDETSVEARFVVTQVIRGASADRDGTIQNGDVLVHVDGRAVTLLSLAAISSMIKGVAGTFVSLGFERYSEDGAKLPIEVKLMRGTPEWLSLFDKYESLRLQLIDAENRASSVHQAFVKSLADNANQKLELDTTRAQLSTTEEAMMEKHKLLQEEQRARRDLEQRLLTISSEMEADSAEIQRLRQQLNEAVSTVKLTKAEAQDIFEKLQQEIKLREYEQNRRNDAETREAAMQENVAIEFQKRRAAETVASEGAQKIQDLERELSRVLDLLAAASAAKKEAQDSENAVRVDLSNMELRESAARSRIASLESKQRADADQLNHQQQNIASLDAQINDLSARLQTALRTARSNEERAERAEERIAKDEKEISDLHVTLEGRTIEAFDARAALTEQEREQDRYRQRIAQLERHSAEDAEELRRLRPRLAELEDEVTKLLHQFNEEKRSREEDVRRLKDELAVAHHDIEAHVNSAEALRAQIATMQGEIIQSQNANAQLGAEVATLHRQLSAVEESKSIADRSVEHLREEVARLRLELDALQRERDQLVISLETTTRARDVAALHENELTQQVNRLEHDLNNNKTIELGLRAAMSSLQERYTTSTNQIEQAAAEAEKAAHKLSVQNERIAQLEGMLGDLRRERLSIESSVLAKQDRIARLEASLQQSERESALTAKNLTEVESDRARLMTENSAYQHELISRQQQNAAVSAQRDAALSKSHELEAALQGAREDIVALNRNVNEAQEDLRRKRAAFEEVVNEHRRCALRESDLVMRVEELQAEVDSLQRLKIEIDNLRRDLGISSKEAKDFEQQLLQCNKICAQRAADIEQLSLELSRNQQSAAKMRELESRLRQLTIERDSARNELAEFLRMPEVVGVGMELETDSTAGVCRVKSLVNGFSAVRSGAIKAGDLVVEVDGHPTRNVPASDIRPLIVGKRGSTVSLLLERYGQRFSVVLKRGYFGPEHADVTLMPVSAPTSGNYDYRSSSNLDVNGNELSI